MKPSRIKIRLAKYHGLGNDYLVIDPAELDAQLSREMIRSICDRHYGIGSDGILWGPLQSEKADFALRIFNPDGSEAEKSGNGLRIFARYLWDRELVKTAGENQDGKYSARFSIETPGGVVRAQIICGGSQVEVGMGKASFDSQHIPVSGPPREVINETMQVASRELHYCGVTLGNPHCVVLCERISPETAKLLGPLIENERRFPRRTNVQFLKVLDRRNLQIEIWERGAGYTLASGSSACAATAAAHRLGLCEDQVTVQMPGGELAISIQEDYSITMIGPVEKVYKGEIEIFSRGY